MSQWMQYVVVAMLVGGAGLYVFRGLVGTLRTGKGAGSCCSKGCGGAATSQKTIVGGAKKGDVPASSSTNGPAREVFFPSELLYRKRR